MSDNDIDDLYCIVDGWGLFVVAACSRDNVMITTERDADIVKDHKT